MAADLLIVVGVVLAGFGCVGVVSDHSERRRPRGTALLVLIGVAFLLAGAWRQPGGFRWESLPLAFVHVAARIVN
ncbi:hypothetical protein ACFQXB_01965 [Plastorhodobacter daqingensis]|uniref:Uncharacterized protein n=1 Tax=Plastorhodobacter daqingensis TaxID=1387281 RepID=A0ABW2UE43_9RHOB